MFKKDKLKIMELEWKVTNLREELLRELTDKNKLKNENKELKQKFSELPRKDYLKILSITELNEIAQSLGIYIDKDDDKAELIFNILDTEKRIQEL
jgi:uncharacterized small protein (DUF1192 family)